MALIDEIKKKYPGPDRWAMRDALFAEISGGPLWKRDKTIIDLALREHGYDTIADEMKNCRPSNPCRSPYCDQCQRVLFNNQKKRFEEFLITPYKSDEDTARQNLFFVTVLHELVPFDQPEEGILRFPTKRVQSALSGARMMFKLVRRSFKDQIIFVGAFELEAVNGQLADLHPVKGKVLAEMNGTKINLSEKFILVHSHFIVDLGKINSDPATNKLPVDLFKEKVRKIWTGTRQVDVSRLYKTKPVTESLNRLSDYPLKFPIKYYFRFNSIAADNEVIIDGKKQNLARNFETAVLAEMIKGVSDIGLNALFIRQGLTKASNDNP